MRDSFDFRLKLAKLRKLKIWGYFCLYALVAWTFLFRFDVAFCWDKTANVAGKFYPANPTILRRQVQNYIKKANIPDGISPSDIICIFSPHAGYVFAGKIAGYAYKAVEDKKVDLVIVMGPSHYYPFYGVRVLNADGYETPLGRVKIDKKLVSSLVDKIRLVSVDNSVFEKEHSVEVQLPFLQVLFPNAEYVLMLFGDASWQDLNQMAKSMFYLLHSIGKRLLLVVSTDMSHYYPYKEAIRKDEATIDVLRSFKVKDFYYGAKKRKYELCGWIPATFALLYSKYYNNVEFRLLKYANSGDTYGNTDSVVGYMAAVVLKKNTKEVSMFTKKQKATLLKLARRSIEHYLKTHQRLKDLGVTDPFLYKERGAFVTLKENGRLRGCIGHIIADMPLCEVVAEMAIQAAVGDPRFQPLTLDELPKVEIEISVLSPLKKVEDINDIKIGKHGLLLRKGFYSGLLLPQVPVEYGWDRSTFLRQLAVKAGLPPDQWRGAELYSFTADVFSESEVFGDKKDVTNDED